MDACCTSSIPLHIDMIAGRQSNTSLPSETRVRQANPTPKMKKNQPLGPLVKTTARGFEPLRAEPNGFLVHHLNHSVTLSLASSSICIILGLLSLGCRRIKSFFEGRESESRCIVVCSHRGQTYQGATQSPCADKLRLLSKRFGEFLNISPLLIGPVAQWIRHRPTEPGIAGSSPAGVILRITSLT